MATMNIAGLTPVDDPSYRYKMPKIIAKVEGRGNGIKTVVVNVVEVSQSLNREAPEITKFFGCELGAQTTYAADTDRAVVNGAHTAATLQTQLSRYIENFVLCVNCKLPETHYKIKSGIISQKCLACGHKESVDMTHKLTTFILAQHKKAKETAAKSDSKSDAKKDKKKDKKEDKDDEKESAAAVNEDGSSPVKEKKKEKKEKKAARSDSPPLDQQEEGGEAKVSASSLDQVTEGVGKLAVAAPESEELDTESDKAAVDASITRFVSWYQTNKDKPMEIIIEELRMIQTFASLHVRYRVIIFIGSLLTEAVISAKEIITFKPYFKALVGTNPASQRHLIAAFEWFCGVKYPSLLKLFPVVLKVLFDEEIVEEDVILAWHKDYTRTEYSADDSLISLDVLEELRATAGPFITWLEEAEEEDDEEDEEDEEDEA